MKTEDSWSLGRDLYPGPTEYKRETLSPAHNIWYVLMQLQYIQIQYIFSYFLLFLDILSYFTNIFKFGDEFSQNKLAPNGATENIMSSIKAYVKCFCVTSQHSDT